MVEGHKFASLQDLTAQGASVCSRPVDNEWCKELVILWGCTTPWNKKCPNTDHPLGAAHNSETLEQTCQSACNIATTQEVSNETKANLIHKRMQEAAQLTMALEQQAKQASQAGNADTAKYLETIATAEAFLQMKDLPGHWLCQKLGCLLFFTLFGFGFGGSFTSLCQDFHWINSSLMPRSRQARRLPRP